MKKPFTPASMLFAAYLTVGTYSLWANVTQVSAAATEGLTPLTITLLPTKQQFILCEPIPLLFKVTNESNSRIDFQVSWMFAVGCAGSHRIRERPISRVSRPDVGTCECAWLAEA